MWTRILSAAIVVWAVAGELRAQTAAPASQADGAGAWRPSERPAEAGAVVPAAASRPAVAPGVTPTGTPAAVEPHHAAVRVTAGNGTLPNEQGQVWREYDIGPYTSRVTTTKRPEQAVVDWILRETGYEAWHSEPLGILSATPRTLRVYHTPQMQAVVAELVERFVVSDAEARTFSLRIATIDSPNWRVRAQRVLHPVPVQSAGGTAWLMPKEEAAILSADLQRRTDYHSAAPLLVNNGQSSLVSVTRGRSYVRDVVARPDLYPGFEAQSAQIDEGFSLDFSPLASADRRTIDATIKCGIDEVEKLVPILLEVPAANGSHQRAKIDVPQMSHFRFQERFRWPADQVLLVSMGMVALPLPVDGRPAAAGVSLPFLGSAPRAELLVFVESKGAAAEAPGAAGAPTREAFSRRSDAVSPR